MISRMSSFTRNREYGATQTQMSLWEDSADCRKTFLSLAHKLLKTNEIKLHSDVYLPTETASPTSELRKQTFPCVSGVARRPGNIRLGALRVRGVVGPVALNITDSVREI
jgi:hypothetical protein